jgi:predicted anti-sigma-YlaC factor YlaD
MLTPVPPSDCTRARESASARLDGELAELQAAQLEAHLRACPECQAFADGIAASAGLLRAAALGQPSGPTFTPMPQRRRRIGVLPAVAAAAIMIAVAGSSFAVGGMLGGRQSARTPAPTTTASAALGGSIDALILPELLMPRSTTSHGRTIAL